MSSCSTLTALSFQGLCIALHSRIIYAVFFWQYNRSNPLETGWNQNCLLHHSLQGQAGEASAQHVLTNTFPAPRAALPTWTAQQGALGFPEPNIGIRELPLFCLNSLIFVCLQLPLVRNQELPPFTVISAERPWPEEPWCLTSLCFQRCQDKLQLREGIVRMGSLAPNCFLNQFIQASVRLDRNQP